MTTAPTSPSTDGGREGSAAAYSLEFVAVGANRQANCSSWGRNGLVAYAASKFVGIYDPLVRLHVTRHILLLALAEASALPQHSTSKVRTNRTFFA